MANPTRTDHDILRLALHAIGQHGVNPEGITALQQFVRLENWNALARKMDGAFSARELRAAYWSVMAGGARLFADRNESPDETEARITRRERSELISWLEAYET